MSGHRQAAAALHGLGEHDRDLILGQLPQADQGVLRSYLAELTALGFQSEALAAAPARAARGAPDLAAASPEQMYSLLEHEPVSLVAQVLALQEWRWAQGLLALYPAARRERLRAAGSAAPAPARERFLRAALVSRLSAGLPAPAATAPSASMAAVRRWWKSWQR